MAEVMVNLKLIVNDKTSEVRRATYIMIGRLLNGFPGSILKEWEAELVQLLLNGLIDEQQDVVILCSEMIESVGKNIKELESENIIEEEKSKPV